jgi:hypothetical protein
VRVDYTPHRLSSPWTVIGTPPCTVAPMLTPNHLGSNTPESARGRASRRARSNAEHPTTDAARKANLSSNRNGLSQKPCRLNGLFQFLGGRFCRSLILGQINRHGAMFGTVRRADIPDLRGGNPDEEAAAFRRAFGLEHPGCLFLLATQAPDYRLRVRC